MEINKTTMREIRNRINQALEPLAAEFGLSKLELGSGSYRAGYFTFKLEGVANDGVSPEGESYNSWQKLMNLKPLGTTIAIGTDKYTSTGLNRTRTKVLAVNQQGKLYAIPVSWFKEASS